MDEFVETVVYEIFLSMNRTSSKCVCTALIQP